MQNLPLFRWLAIAVVVLTARADAPVPAWWSNGVIDSLATNPPDNWAMANVGQLKNIATMAKAHIEASLPAPQAGWVTAWNNAYAPYVCPFPFSTVADPDNFSAVTIGQLKFVASGFYKILHAKAPAYDVVARLQSLGVSPAAISGTGPYFPWGAPASSAENYDAVTIGQLKIAFSFDLGNLICTAPSFTIHPQSRTVYAGANVTFTAAASGSPTPTYRWCKDGNNISGATSSTCSITNVQSAHAGNYTVVVTNAAGSAVSNPATLALAVTVRDHSALAVDSRLHQGGSKVVWSSKDDVTAAYVRNTSAWASGLTGVSAKVVWTPTTWNGEPATSDPFGAIAVASDIVLVEYHVKSSFTVGMTLRFVTEDGANTVATRTIIAVADHELSGGPVNGDGWCVCRLDSPLPDGVKWLKVAPANLAAYLPDIAFKLPVLRMDSHELEFSVAELSALPRSASTHFTVAAAASAPRSSYNHTLISGDSSNPVCMVVNGELVLLGLHYSSTSAPPIWLNLDAINTAIAATGSSSTLTSYDLSAYPTFP